VGTTLGAYVDKDRLGLPSLYPLTDGAILWIITEAVDDERSGRPTHRERTTLALPADY
jgi:hypothetical protein